MPSVEGKFGTGVIHDIGYRHYDGPRGGRRQNTRALYVHSHPGGFGHGRAAPQPAQ